MPDSVKEKVMKLFKMIDVDGSGTIDREETLDFWKSNFAKVNTKELFNQVDKNNDGSIQLEEWIGFWTEVYSSGYNEEELNFELENLINKGSWVKFKTKDNSTHEKDNNMKIKGKI